MLDQYQIDLKNAGLEILRKHNIVYYALEMRTGKTRISLHTANENVENPSVLFVTKKKAIASVLHDYKDEGFAFTFDVTNYESVHKFDFSKYNVIVIDEAHSLGAFPKPSLRTKSIREQLNDQYVIYLSGTPSPESHSQLFHQFWVTKFSPWAKYPNFYKWAKDYVKVTQKRAAGGQFVNDYSNADIDKIDADTKHLFVNYTQEEAGFKGKVYDHCLTVKAPEAIHTVIRKLLKNDLAYIRKDDVRYMIVADTVLKLKQKIHQISSGTIKIDGTTRLLLSDYKAQFIKREFAGKKIAIFYKYIAERDLLKQFYGVGNYTECPEEFNNSDNLVFLGQLQSASEGVNLMTAEALVFYNIDYSFKTYWQARARMQNRKREVDSHCYYIFSDTNLEQQVYNLVQKKRDFTSYYFKKYFLKK